MASNNAIGTPKDCSENKSNVVHVSPGAKQKKYKLSLSPSASSTSRHKPNSSSEEVIVRCKRILSGSKSCVCALCLSLYGSAMEDFPGREKEAIKLQEFLQQHIEKEASGSLCISGPPGIGKAIWLSKIMQQPEIKSKLKMVYINCITTKSAAAIYIKIIQNLSITNSKKPGRNSKAIIEEYLISEHKMVLLVLDEIEKLEGDKHHVLYTIFEWPSLPNSRLIVFGIVNNLRLTRILPTLWSRCTLKPILIRFMSYTKDEIFSIISARLNEANATNVFTSFAIHKIAIKVATASKDLGQAMEISRRLVKLAKLRRASHALDLSDDKDTNVDTSKKQEIVEVKPFDVEEVIPLLNEVAQLSRTQHHDKQNTFLYELKMLLLFRSFMLILKKGENEDITFGMLYRIYRKVCKKRNVFVDSMEFLSGCSLAERQGFLKITYKKELNLSKVDILWD